jgi:hypothetical protein
MIFFLLTNHLTTNLNEEVNSTGFSLLQVFPASHHRFHFKTRKLVFDLIMGSPAAVEVKESKKRVSVKGGAREREKEKEMDR